MKSNIKSPIPGSHVKLQGCKKLRQNVFWLLMCYLYLEDESQTSRKVAWTLCIVAKPMAQLLLPSVSFVVPFRGERAGRKKSWRVLLSCGVLCPLTHCFGGFKRIPRFAEWDSHQQEGLVFFDRNIRRNQVPVGLTFSFWGCWMDDVFDWYTPPSQSGRRWWWWWWIWRSSSGQLS